MTMKSPMKSDSIQTFIIANERNLRLAAVVSEAWSSAREQLVAGFLGRLRSYMGAKLKGWDSILWNRFFVDSESAFYLWKPQWKDQYSVALQCSDYGTKMVFGVQRDARYIRSRPFSADVLSAVRAHHASASSRTWWEAAVTMRSPAANWQRPEVLWQMHKEDKFLKDVAEQLLEVAQATEGIIDS